MTNNRKVLIALLVFLGLVFMYPRQNGSFKQLSFSKYQNHSFVALYKSNVNLRIQLLELKRALIQSDRESIKAFFSFPVVNHHNEIWYHVKASEKLLLEKGRPFKEHDFDAYFDELFPQVFTEKWRELNVDSLLSTSTFSTRPFNCDGYSNQIHFDLVAGELSVNWYSEVVDEENEDMPYEYSVIYFFSINENGIITFKEIRIAG